MKRPNRISTNTTQHTEFGLAFAMRTRPYDETQVYKLVVDRQRRKNSRSVGRSFCIIVHLMTIRQNSIQEIEKRKRRHATRMLQNDLKMERSSDSIRFSTVHNERIRIAMRRPLGIRCARRRRACVLRCCCRKRNCTHERQIRRIASNGKFPGECLSVIIFASFFLFANFARMRIFYRRIDIYRRFRMCLFVSARSVTLSERASECVWCVWQYFRIYYLRALCCGILQFVCNDSSVCCWWRVLPATRFVA